jgi:hypothetical protein
MGLITPRPDSRVLRGGTLFIFAKALTFATNDEDEPCRVYAN